MDVPLLVPKLTNFGVCMKPVFIALAFFALVGCATPPDNTVAATTTDTRICERYYPIGSNIPSTRCFTAEEIKLRQMADEKGVDDVRAVANRKYSKPMGANP